jgi:acyl-CoA thioesterase
VAERPAPADLRAALRLEPGDRPGRYRTVLSDSWNAALFPFGGVMSALGVSAMIQDLDHPSHVIRSATTVFASAVSEGPLSIDVVRLRVGRRMSQLSATVRNAGSDDAGHVTLASFGEVREGFEFTAARMPDCNPPEECSPPEEPPPDFDGWRSSFFEQLDVRPVYAFPPWRDDWEGGRAECIRWVRYRHAPRLESGEVDPLAMIALADMMPPSIAMYLGPDHPFYYAPSCDLTVHVLGTTREEWLLAECSCSLAGGGYASARQRLWDRTGALLVEASQLMYLRLGERGQLGAPRTAST